MNELFNYSETFTCRPQTPTAFIMDALCTTLKGISRLLARKIISVCVVAPNGSPMTSNATSPTLAAFNISSAPCSTNSLSAAIISLP